MSYVLVTEILPIECFFHRYEFSPSL